MQYIANFLKNHRIVDSDLDLVCISHLVDIHELGIQLQNLTQSSRQRGKANVVLVLRLPTLWELGLLYSNGTGCAEADLIV